MFTGIVEGVGCVKKLERRNSSARLIIGLSRKILLRNLKVGDSIAVNGCCLTVAQKSRDGIAADLSGETLRLTNLGQLLPGQWVNLERPMGVRSRFGGHLVQGHVDGVGKILTIRRNNGKGAEIRIGIPSRLRRYLMTKGSIAVDGISMTVHRLRGNYFTLVVIPHTLKSTNLKGRQVGDPVNLEVDIIGKYIESLASKK